MNNYDPNFKPVKQYTIVGQKVVISNGEDKILLLKRSNKSGAGSKWSIAGGGLDKGEQSEAGILREIEEETQITVSELKPFFVKTYMSNDDFIVIIGYKAKYKSGEVVLNWEHDAYQWVSKEEALTMDLTPDAIDLISRWKA
jgi:8-oxo-dGTP pyrophosphatase MutT (NUDIX family)